jgi:hypothetical protein
MSTVVEPTEQAVLERAVVDIDGWIADLPSDSPWRVAFTLSRRELLDALDLDPMAGRDEA